MIGIDEFLAVLISWGQVGAPCDLAGPPGVGIDELLAVLGLWGTVPEVRRSCTSGNAWP